MIGVNFDLRALVCLCRCSHGMSYPIAGNVKTHSANGYSVEHPLVVSANTTHEIAASLKRCQCFLPQGSAHCGRSCRWNVGRWSGCVAPPTSTCPYIPFLLSNVFTVDVFNWDELCLCVLSLTDSPSSSRLQQSSTSRRQCVQSATWRQQRSSVKECLAHTLSPDTDG